MRHLLQAAAAVLAAIALFAFPSSAWAQAAGIAGLGGIAGGGGGGFAGLAGGAAGVGGGLAGGQAGGLAGGQAGVAGAAGAAGAAGGININASGVVTPVFKVDRAAQLARKRMESVAKTALEADVTQASPLRKVSLVRLEEACREYAESNEHVPLEMQFLAGLQRIDYVFVYPDTGDVVVAGPAEAFAPDPVGRVVGVTTGRPALRLDDLMVALRAVQRAGNLGCSIDPDPDRMAAMQQWIKANSTPTTPRIAQARYAKMAEILGMQNVRVWGVPADSHFAAALVEADYHMKLVSIGREQYRVRGFQSHLDMLGRGGNSVQRWWFAPLYDAFVRSEDGNAFRFAGQRLQLMSQEEVTDELGRRHDAAFTRVTTQRWAEEFTKHFSELAEQSSSFAELQNLVDLAVLAALLKKERLPDRVGWSMSLFLDPDQGRIAEHPAPKSVPSAFNAKMGRGRVVLGLVGGGVVVSPLETIAAIQPEEDGKLAELRTAQQPRRAAKEHPWWWD